VSDSILTLMQAAKRLRFERPQEALRLYTEAAARCRQEGQRRELIQALKGQGQIERDTNHLDLALASYEEAADLCREESDPLWLAHTLRHVADIHQDAERNEVALPFYREALEIYRKQTDTNLLDLANTVRPLAALKESMGDFVEATRLWQEARELYAASSVPQGVAECSRRLARLGSQQNNDTNG
jgi:tetratricopeptide (TPR) repeat protein